MIELVIAAILSVSSLSTDVTTSPAPEATETTIAGTDTRTGTTPPSTGGTGTWDDNN